MACLFIDYISKLKRDRVVKKFQRPQSWGKLCMRLVFMGTPEFSVECLKALLAAGHEIVCAYAQPPRPAGRGMALQPHARSCFC